MICYEAFFPPFYLYYKVHIFWESHKIVRNLHQLFDWQSIGQKIGGNFAKFCGLLRIYELYIRVKYIPDNSKTYHTRAITNPTFWRPKILRRLLNRLSMRKRGMAVVQPTFHYTILFFCIFPINFAMASLGLKEMGKFLWEGRKKSLPSWLSQFSFAKLRQPDLFPYLPKRIFSFPSTLS